MTNCGAIRCSEDELQRQLGRAGTADLVEGVEAAGLAAGAERGSEHLGGLAEEGRGQVVGRGAEVGVVEEVEEVGAGLEGQALVEFELAAEGQVDSAAPKPLRTLRPRVPWTGPVGLVKAALLMRLPPATLGSEIQRGMLGTRLGRWTLVAPERE